MTSNSYDYSTNVAQPPLSQEPTRAPSKRKMMRTEGVSNRCLDCKDSRALAPPPAAPRVISASEVSYAGDSSHASSSDGPIRRQRSSKSEMAAEALQRYINRQSSYTLSDTSSTGLSRRTSLEPAVNEEWSSFNESFNLASEGALASGAMAPEPDNGAAIFLQVLNDRKFLIKNLKSIMDLSDGSQKDSDSDNDCSMEE